MPDHWDECGVLAYGGPEATASLQVKSRTHLITKGMRRVPGLRREVGKSGLTFPVRFEVAVDRGWLDLTRSAGASVHRKGYRRVAELVKVMGPWAHGDVDTLGIITCSLHGQQGGGTWIHGHVVVFGIGAVRSAYKCFPWLGGRVKEIQLSLARRNKREVRIYIQGKKSQDGASCAGKLQGRPWGNQVRKQTGRQEEMKSVGPF